jgi:hypothetical protein
MKRPKLKWPNFYLNNTMPDKIKLIDPFTNIDLLEIPATSQENQGATFLSDLRELNIGDGGNNVFRADKSGIWLGAKTYGSAPFRVSMAGAVVASDFTLLGGSIKYGKTSWADSTNSGYYLGSEGIYAGKAADATLFKFTIGTGALEYTGKIVAGVGSDLAAGYITGSITAGQIGSVNATTITGTITASQIGSVNASTITGTITASQIASVNASAITGLITSTQISSVNATSISGSITAGQIGSVNATTINGVIVTAQLADQIINSLSLFATDLRPIKQVSTLPSLPDASYPIGATVYLTSDQKLYRNAGGAWSSTAAASDITGTLTASQIGSVNSSAITGLILAGQISTIAATQITGQIQAAQIGTVNASTIQGSIYASQIATVNASAITGSISASQISSVYASSISGTITAGQIASITAGQITGYITSSQISSVNASSITGSISYSQIGSVNANTITINQISNSQIASMSASKLTAGTIDASVITVTNLNASNITAGTLNVGGGSQPAAIVISHTTGYPSPQTGLLKWVGGSCIFEDYSNYLGLISTGERIYFYTGAANLFALFQRYAQASFYTGVFCGGALNVGNSSTNQDARFTGRIKLYDSGEDQYIESSSAQIRFYSYDQFEFYQNGDITAIIDDNFWTQGNVYGSAKYFNIAHPDGSARRLQYTAQESPDVVVKLRGIAKIGNDGKCEIVPVAHYSLVTEKKGLTTISLTSLETENNLYVGEISNEKVVVNGKPNSSFMYEIAAIRKGYLNAPVEIANDKDPIMIKMSEAKARSDQRRAEWSKRIKDKVQTVA